MVATCLPLLLLLAAAASAARVPTARTAPIERLPEWMEVCSRNEPDLNSCIKEKIAVNMPNLIDGVPEINAPSLDPFVVREMLVEYRQGDVTGKMLVKNSRSYGLSGLIVDAVRINLNDSGLFRCEVDFSLPRVFIEGDYKAQGKIVVFPINGKGVYNISMTDVKGTWNVTGEYVKKGRHTILRLQHFDMFPEVGDMKLYASNLFTGNDEFNKAALVFANEFWPVLYGEMLPYANEAWDKVMRGEANKVLSRIPFDLLFPDQ